MEDSEGIILVYASTDMIFTGNYRTAKIFTISDILIIKSKKKKKKRTKTMETERTNNHCNLQHLFAP